MQVYQGGAGECNCKVGNRLEGAQVWVLHRGLSGALSWGLAGAGGVFPGFEGGVLVYVEFLFFAIVKGGDLVCFLSGGASTRCDLHVGCWMLRILQVRAPAG